MKAKRTCRSFITLAIFCLLAMPFAGYAADLTIADMITTIGNWTVSGTMNATSFAGNGSGLTNVSAASASSLSCSGCISPSQLSFTPGTITGVTAGTGMSGGGASGNVTLNVAFDGTGGTSTAARSDHNHDTVYQKRYGRVAVVANSGGDYTSPLDAMNYYATWCAPSAANPCLVKIMPGVYSVGTSTVVMQPYIDIEGSGENVTVIEGSIDSAYGVVNGANNAELRLLTVSNMGGGTNARAIYNDNASPKLTNVTFITLGGANYAYGVRNNSSSPTMTNVTISASGGLYTYGVGNVSSSSPTMTNVTISLTGGSYTYGVYNSSSSPIMTNVIISASGGTYNYGVENYVSASPTMTNVTISASGGAQSYGVRNEFSSSPTMKNAIISASGAASNCGVCSTNSPPTMAMTNVTATASGGSYNYGVSNNPSSPTMTDVTATASGGSYNYGVWNSNSSPTMTNVTATASGGPFSYGVHNDTAGTVKINLSLIRGTTKAIFNDATTATIGNTQLDGGTVNSGTLTCAGVYDGNYAFYVSTCP